eukprot:4052242-Karenia_brevis.AAC.1
MSRITASAVDNYRTDQSLVEWSANNMPLAEMSMDQLLDDITSKSSPKLLHHPPSKYEIRIGEL